VFTHRLRVRYGECDPQGIVYNANYLMYFDVAFTELWREAVGPWQDMVDRGLDAVVAEAAVRFRAPARYDDELDIRGRLTRLGATGMTTAFEIARGDEMLVEATLRHVMVDAATWQKAAIPDWVRTGLERYVDKTTA
jgi:acyl-CoA thioester hydrolase